MTSTYARVMTGSKITAPPVNKHWVYLLVASLVAAMAAMAPGETLDLLTDPVGTAASIAIAAGFMVTRSMALTPWGFISASLLLYAVARTTPSVDAVVQVAQLLAITGAVAVAFLQLRVKLVSGDAASRPPRARWGSVLVAATAALTVIVLGFPHLPLVLLVRSDHRDHRGYEVAISKSGYGRAVSVGRVGHPSLIEGSGLAASQLNRGLLWAHNDSGHPPLIYCLERTGDSCGVWDVTGAAARDWEDIALGPGPQSGQSYLYVGDIGDNAGALPSVTVYRFPEPRVDASSRASTADLPVPTAAAEAIELRYPDGAHDAEVLIVHPQTGDLYIITKEVVSGVYKATAPLNETGTTTLERVARFSIFANFADRTGGTISPDGQRVALSTYGGAFEFMLPRSPTDVPTGFDAIWKQMPASIDVPNPMQLEAITYSATGRAILLMPEGVRSPIYRSQLRR